MANAQAIPVAISSSRSGDGQETPASDAAVPASPGADVERQRRGRDSHRDHPAGSADCCSGRPEQLMRPGVIRETRAVERIWRQQCPRSKVEIASPPRQWHPRFRPSPGSRRPGKHAGSQAIARTTVARPSPPAKSSAIRSVAAAAETRSQTGSAFQFVLPGPANSTWRCSGQSMQSHWRPTRDRGCSSSSG